MVGGSLLDEVHWPSTLQLVFHSLSRFLSSTTYNGMSVLKGILSVLWNTILDMVSNSEMLSAVVELVT
jgi:hypothetical protein